MLRLAMWINNAQLFVKNKLLIAGFCSAAVLNVLLWGVLLVNQDPDATIIPLHYNVYFGIDLMGPWQTLFNIPLFGVVILFFHALFAYLVIDYEKHLSVFMVWVSVLQQIFLGIAAFYILFFLNG